jgi:hypothetical protein
MANKNTAYSVCALQHLSASFIAIIILTVVSTAYKGEASTWYTSSFMKTVQLPDGGH